MAQPERVLKRCDPQKARVENWFSSGWNNKNICVMFRCTFHSLSPSLGLMWIPCDAPLSILFRLLTISFLMHSSTLSFLLLLLLFFFLYFIPPACPDNIQSMWVFDCNQNWLIFMRFYGLLLLLFVFPCLIIFWCLLCRFSLVLS